MRTTTVKMITKLRTVAALAFLSTAALGVTACTNGADKSCSTHGCTSSAHLLLAVKASADDLRAATIKACRNAACSQGTPAIVPSTTGDREEMSLRGSTTVQGYVSVNGDGVFTVDTIFPIDDSAPAANGDVYDLTVTDASGVVIAALANKRAQYTDTAPNGPDCPPVCKNTTIQ